MAMKDLNVIWNKIDTPKPGDNGCWNWIGELDQFGHGILEIDGFRCLSHKYVAWAIKGYVNFNFPVTHLCNNRKCCNPNHIVIGLVNTTNCYLTKISKVYGPYKRKDGREHVLIILKDGQRLTRSYPKFLMEYELAIELDPILHTVDHIDRDFTNNNRSNLQILSKSENSKKSAKRRKPTKAKCVWCNKEFILSKNQLVKRRTKNLAGPFCSRVCSGKYGKAVQNNKVPLITAKSIKVEYYKLDDHLAKEKTKYPVKFVYYV